MWTCDENGVCTVTSIPPSVTKEIGDIFVNNDTGQMYIWEGDTYRQVASADYDIRDYELVMGDKGKLVPRTDHKLAEKPLDTTHPTVLTWLIRYVDLGDIIQMFHLLEFLRQRHLMSLRAVSLKDSFSILIPGDGFRFFEWSKKYEGVGEPPVIGEIVQPIIK